MGGSPRDTRRVPGKLPHYRLLVFYIKIRRAGVHGAADSFSKRLFRFIMGSMAKYDPREIEPKWQKEWLKERTYEPDLDGAKRPFYNLWMFPYPSAEGLHIGGARTFTGVDIFGRFKRMQGYDVFEPVGLDGFGIHSENYALKIGKHPAQHAKDSEQNFYRQLHLLGNGYAWDEKLETYDPGYYRWTQWIFVQMWKHNLAYRKKQPVNWCPNDKTVLADEQVEGGKCERCGTEVEKRELEQWFFKITKYAGKLLDNLEHLDWSEKVKIAQKNWIGRSEGAEITFEIKDRGNSVAVFTTRPDTLFGATYLVLAPEHSLVKSLQPNIRNWEEVRTYIASAENKKESERAEEGKEKTGVELKGVKAINPANNKEIPVWVADYVLASYGTGAIMAVPAHDERDFEFAKKFGLPIRTVIIPAPLQAGLGGVSSALGGASPGLRVNTDLWEGVGILVDSGDFSGMDSEKAKWEIAKFAHGERKTTYRLRDWLISRQRYWGPPIPMIFCGACAKAGKGEHKDMAGWYAVPERDLPVVLPYIENFRPMGSGVSPLATDKGFYEVGCPACGAPARRETDVSDTFLDSSWYFLRYPSTHDNDRAWNEKITKKWLPVNSYIGGAEHSVLHLLYSRFVTMAFHDMGALDFEEPFTKFVAHGLITKDGAKMSKSKGNVVNPDDYFGKFGIDVMRMHLAFMAPLEDGGDFREETILGIERFLKRVWEFAHGPMAEKAAHRPLLHRTIKKVGEDIENLHYNTAISALMILLRDFEENNASQKEVEVFLKLLAPFAPYLTEEVWRNSFRQKTSIHRESWPAYDPKLLATEAVTIVFQVNGKMRDAVPMDASVTEDVAKKAALANEKVARALGSATPKRIIYVDKKLVNIVT
jgi:leucyl-tRNA synthetase